MKFSQRYHLLPLLLLCLLGIFSFLVTIISHERLLGQSGNSIDIFVDTLSTEFQDWSWGNTSHTVVSGEWHITIGDAWGALRLRSEDAYVNGVPIENVGAIVFSARAAAEGGGGGGSGASQTVDVLFETSPSVYGPRVTITLTDQMQTYTVSHDQTPIVGVVWQDRGTGGTDIIMDNIYLEIEETPTPTPTPPGDVPVILNVDPTNPQGQIDPHIYGISFANSQLAAELDLPLNRWGGNATTRYNWEESVSNRANDWYFLNVPDEGVDVNNLPDTSTFNDFVQQNQQTGTDSLLTIPMIGWTPNGRNYDCGFRVSIYGAQDSTEPGRPDCGNGYTNTVPLLGSSPLDTSVPISETYAQDWISYIDNRYGSSEVTYYVLDNEPMLWNVTHRDVYSAPVGYDDIRDLSYQYAAAIKLTNPQIKTLGPASWGWDAYFFSAKDRDEGGPLWWQNPPDRNAHGGQPFLEWYLDQMTAYEQNNGLRILDYLDIHYYQQPHFIGLSNNVTPSVQQQRLRSTRALWDSTYVDESWIAQPVMLIPRMQQIIQTHYPGTKLAIGEYNWGATDHINGALAQADVLGIYGREGVDMAIFWANPATNEPVSYAFRLFRNYDGQGGQFGDQVLMATSDDEEKVSVYAASRNDGFITIMAINKTLAPATIDLTTVSASGLAQVYQYSEQNLNTIVQLADRPLNSSTVMPANSIQLLVYDPAASTPPGTVTQIAPLNNISSTSPTFIWRPDPIATGYTIALYNETTDSIDFISPTPHLASAVCTGSDPVNDTCATTPALDLSLGSYKWLIRAVKGSILGPWSSFP